MCPLCISTAAMIAAGTTSAGVLGLIGGQGQSFAKASARATYIANEIHEE